MSGLFHNDTTTVAYLITCEANGRQYVGITKTSVQRRWRGHVQKARQGLRTALCAAIRKYGEGCFSVQQIASCLKREWAAAVERELIRQYGTKAPGGYNLTDGGDGVFGLSAEIRERIAAKTRGRKHTPEARAAIAAAGKGRQLKQVTRAAISEAHKGKTLSDAHRAKLSASKMGKKMPTRTAEHCARIAAGLVAAHARRRAAQ